MPHLSAQLALSKLVEFLRRGFCLKRRQNCIDDVEDGKGTSARANGTFPGQSDNGCQTLLDIVIEEHLTEELSQDSEVTQPCPEMIASAGQVLELDTISVEVRAARSFLVGLKYMLQAWDWNVQGTIRLDEQLWQLTVDDELKASVSLDSGLTCCWHSDWQSWKALHESSDLAQLLSHSQRIMNSKQALAQMTAEFNVLTRIWDSQALLRQPMQDQVSLRLDMERILASWDGEESSEEQLETVLRRSTSWNKATHQAAKNLLQESKLDRFRREKRQVLSKKLEASATAPLPPEEGRDALQLLQDCGLQGYPKLEYCIRRALHLPMTVPLPVSEDRHARDNDHSSFGERSSDPDGWSE